MQQPTPMKELSIWDINAPHLHDYFVSKQGQFKLTQLANGNTLVEELPGITTTLNQLSIGKFGAIL